MRHPNSHAFNATLERLVRRREPLGLVNYASNYTRFAISVMSPIYKTCSITRGNAAVNYRRKVRNGDCGIMTPQNNLASKVIDLTWSKIAPGVDVQRASKRRFLFLSIHLLWLVNSRSSFSLSVLCCPSSLLVASSFLITPRSISVNC